MCGRYTGNDDDSLEMAEIYETALKQYPGAELKHGDIFPTDIAPVIGGAERIHLPASWGYPGYGGKGVIINARAETVLQKSMFRDGILNHRCLVPTTGYYEWDSNKNKYIFTLPGKEVFYMAGICGMFGGKPCFCILTTSPTGFASTVHNRMPVIVTSPQMWLTDTKSAVEYLGAVMPSVNGIRA